MAKRISIINFKGGVGKTTPSLPSWHRSRSVSRCAGSVDRYGPSKQSIHNLSRTLHMGKGG